MTQQERDKIQRASSAWSLMPMGIACAILAVVFRTIYEPTKFPDERLLWEAFIIVCGTIAFLVFFKAIRIHIWGYTAVLGFKADGKCKLLMIARRNGFILEAPEKRSLEEHVMLDGIQRVVNAPLNGWRRQQGFIYRRFSFSIEFALEEQCLGFETIERRVTPSSYTSKTDVLWFCRGFDKVAIRMEAIPSFLDLLHPATADKWNFYSAVERLDQLEKKLDELRVQVYNLLKAGHDAALAIANTARFGKSKEGARIRQRLAQCVFEHAGDNDPIRESARLLSEPSIIVRGKQKA